MRRRSLAAIGAGATATAAPSAQLTTGVVSTSLAVLATPPFAPPAAAQGLQSFQGCEELRQWYVDATLPLVGPWGLGGPIVYARDGVLVARTASGVVPAIAKGAIPEAAAPVAGSLVAGTPQGSTPQGATRQVDAATGIAPVGNGATGTNLQEVDVDEPDVAKTDGRLLVHLKGRDLVVTDVSGDQPEQLSRTRLPGRLFDPELLLLGSKVVVVGSDGYFTEYGDTFPAARLVQPAPGRTHTRLVTYDIGDPTSPLLEHQDRVDGHLVTAREYGGTVRAVVSNDAPAFDFVHPTRRRTAAEATRANRQIVRDSTIDDWLPRVNRRRLLDCTDVRHPEKSSGFGTISVVTFTADAPGVLDATAVTTSGELVYSSADRLYVASQRGGWADPVLLDNRRRADGRRDRMPPMPRTEVHAFALDGDSTDYVASGTVPGTVRDRWSFSEYDGRLRVATALGRSSWQPRENAVVVLEEHGHDLVRVGQVSGMGRHEQIQSVRWFGDLAILVTFRQTDPLYTVDLSDPAHPRVVGELKIRGFSSYLHPLGGDRLLGLGQDATRTGRTLGAQAAVFDLSDLAAPRRLGVSTFRTGTELTVGWDSRAFTYLPDRGTALTPVQNYRTGRTRVAILKVSPDGTIARSLTDPIAGWDASSVRALPLTDGRIAVVSRNQVELLTV